MILGITGPYCSGKNTLSTQISSLGFEVLDLDKIGHLSLDSKKEEIINTFGTKVVKISPFFGNSSNNTSLEIQRKELAKIVFSDSIKLQQLEAIVHPWLQKYIKDYLQKNKKKNIAINAALLFFLELDQYCDFVIILKINRLLRFFRALSRDKLGILQTIRRLKHEKRIPSKKSFKNYKNNAEIQYVRNTREIQRCKQRIEEYIHGELHTL